MRAEISPASIRSLSSQQKQQSGRSSQNRAARQPLTTPFQCARTSDGRHSAEQRSRTTTLFAQNRAAATGGGGAQQPAAEGRSNGRTGGRAVEDVRDGKQRTAHDGRLTAATVRRGEAGGGGDPARRPRRATVGRVDPPGCARMEAGRRCTTGRTGDGERADGQPQQPKRAPGGPQRLDPRRRTADGHRTTGGGAEQ